MDTKFTQQMLVVSQAAIKPGQELAQVSLFKADGTPFPIPTKQAAQADSVAATVGALVTDFNALLAKLRLAGILS